VGCAGQLLGAMKGERLLYFKASRQPVNANRFAARSKKQENRAPKLSTRTTRHTPNDASKYVHASRTCTRIAEKQTSSPTEYSV
jgi:hypothetical protein